MLTNETLLCVMCYEFNLSLLSLYMHYNSNKSNDTLKRPLNYSFSSDNVYFLQYLNFLVLIDYF